VGVPALLLSNAKLWDDLKDDPNKNTHCIFIIFVLVVLIQGLLSAVNKAMDYVCFSAKVWPTPDREQSRSYRLAVWWLKHVWIEFGLDVISIVLLVLATLGAMAILTHSTSVCFGLCRFFFAAVLFLGFA
jgi:hypothetical protein